MNIQEMMMWFKEDTQFCIQHYEFTGFFDFEGTSEQFDNEKGDQYKETTIYENHIDDKGRVVITYAWKSGNYSR